MRPLASIMRTMVRLLWGAVVLVLASARAFCASSNLEAGRPSYHRAECLLRIRSTIAFNEQYSRCQCRLDQCLKGRVARPHLTSVWKLPPARWRRIANNVQ
jgi:hypothetical protein